MIRHRVRGFTLIELIITVVVLAVLAGAAAVTFGQFASSSRRTSVAASASAFRNAIQAKAAASDQSPSAVVAALLAANPDDLSGQLGVAFDGQYKKIAASGGNPEILRLSSDTVGGSCDLTLPAVSSSAPVVTGCADGFIRVPLLVPAAGSVESDFTVTAGDAVPAKVSVAYPTAADRIIGSDTDSADGTIVAQFDSGQDAGTALYFRMTDAKNWVRLRIGGGYTYESYQYITSYSWYWVCPGGWWYTSNPGSCPHGGSPSYTQEPNYATGWHNVDYYSLVLDQSVSGVVTTLKTLGTPPGSGPGTFTVTLSGTTVTAQAKIGTSTLSSGAVTVTANATATGVGVGTAAPYGGVTPYTGGSRTFTGLTVGDTRYIGVA